MSKREMLSEAEMAALLNDDDFSEEEFEGFSQELFSPHDFADFSELVAPLLFEPMSRLAPLIDSTIRFVNPELALRGPDAIASLSGDIVYIPLSFFTKGNRRQPDVLLVLSSGLAAQIAVLMIGGSLDTSSPVVDRSQLSTVTEFFRQYRLLIGRSFNGSFVEGAPAEKSPWLNALLPESTEDAKVLDMIFKGEDHIIELSGTAVLADSSKSSVRMLFPADISKKLLSRARELSVIDDQTDPVVPEVTGLGPNPEALTREDIEERIQQRTQAIDSLSKSAEDIAQALSDSAASKGPHSKSLSASRAAYSSKPAGRTIRADKFEGGSSEDSCTVAARIGEARVSSEKLRSLRTGDIVTLDNPAAEEVDILVDGVVIGRGEVVVENDHYAVRICSLKQGKHSGRRG